MQKIILIFSALLVISSSTLAFDSDVIVKAKRAIKNQVKDPSSLEFRDVFYSYTEKGGGVACGQFNSKNSFGAYTGFTRFISNGKTTFIDGQKDSKPQFPDLWVMLCLNRGS